MLPPPSNIFRWCHCTAFLARAPGDPQPGSERGELREIRCRATASNLAGGWILPRASVPLFSLHHLSWTGLDRAPTPQFLVDPSQPCPRPTGGVWSAPRRAQISVAPASQSASLFLSPLIYVNPRNSCVMFFPESLNFNRTIRFLRKWVCEL